MYIEKLLHDAPTAKDLEILSDSTIEQLHVTAERERHLVIIHDRPDAESLNVELDPEARLKLVVLFTHEAFGSLHIRQAANSCSEVTLLMLGSANSALQIDLEGPHAQSNVGALFLGSEQEHCEINLCTRHMAADCRSESLIKGVASGSATGIFHGLVYVAPDAQRTDARQTSRNIELSSEARIKTLPQLEIYADDVKCSHGATVGQLDGEAILYMRQRGLSERQARRLQIEGFAGDVVNHCAIEQLKELLTEAVVDKLEKM